MNENKPNLNHVAIIMDGNGRWAKKRNLPRSFGHKEGKKSVIKIIEHCYRLGIPYLSLYAFSTENWKRAKEEVDGLMSLLKSFMEDFKTEAVERKIRVKIMGDITPFSKELKEAITEIEESTKDDCKLTVNIGLNYGSRAEIIRAVNLAIEKGQKVDEQSFGQFLYTFDLPDPDLVIRTSGEQRLSNFMCYQSAYSELYFSKVLWPDFDEKEFDSILEEYSKRERRFGKA